MFKNKKANVRKMLAFGFAECGEGYFYSKAIDGCDMKISVMVLRDGTVCHKVTDNAANEEYRLHLSPNAAGAFVGKVREEYESLLEEIRKKCFDPDVFKSEQSKEIINYARERYGDELEFLWEKFPDNAVLRRKDNAKWYAALLTVKAAKIGLGGDGTVEILDLRIKPEEMEHTVDGKRFFPGYHMNKKHWYTLVLDGSVPSGEVYARIDESYILAKK
ncbi:MAG: MmcQ/YjbR family DNA-binding protein [Clostridia bacterium]|nr:MmcQ/YjbR family DNA-binding protein [Clostridia bacterium]MBQ8862793.1 MmcQ/YjbR family DNA-binding protein [Clostridia bacterium]